MKSGKTILGVVAGLAMGAILGILFAPDKGKKTRRQILDKGEDYMDAIKEKFASAKDDVNEYAEDKKAKFNNIKKDVNHAASDIKHAAS